MLHAWCATDRMEDNHIAEAMMDYFLSLFFYMQKNFDYSYVHVVDPCQKNFGGTTLWKEQSILLYRPFLCLFSS